MTSITSLFLLYLYYTSLYLSSSLFACLKPSSLPLASFCLPLHHILLYSPASLSTSPVIFFLAHLLVLHATFYTWSLLPFCSPNPFNIIFTTPLPFCFLCSFVLLLPVAPFPLCCPCIFKFTSLVIAFCLFLEVLRQALTREGHLLADLTGLWHWQWPLALAQCLAMAAQPDSQLSHCVNKQSDCSLADTLVKC